MKLHKVNKWQNNYRGVNFEIVNWFSKDGNQAFWAYYLLFPIAQLDESFWLEPARHDERRDRYYFRAWDHPILAQLRGNGDWTLYERIEVNNRKSIRIGCDYQHLWDEGIIFNEARLLHDVKDSINHLWELLPDMRVYCSAIGGWYSVKDGIWTEQGFISHEGNKWRLENGWEMLEPIGKDE